MTMLGSCFTGPMTPRSTCSENPVVRRLLLIVLKEPDPDSWDGEEEQQGETKRAGSHGVGGPEEAQRQSREWVAGGVGGET